MENPQYRNDPVYKSLETLCQMAGVEIRYTAIPDDQINGELLARADDQGMVIEMPDTDCFPTQEQATLTLGHELAHLVSGKSSSDRPVESVMNEAICDLLGGYLYNLSEMVAGTEAELILTMN